MAEVEGREQLEPERPGWLPESFRNPEALVESYNQAVGRLSQVSEERNELEETLSAVLESQEQAEPVQAPPARPQVDHLDLLRMLADRASQQVVSQIPARGDFDVAAQAHANRVADLVQQDPELRAINVGDLIGQIPDEYLSSAESTVYALRGLAQQEQVSQLHSAVTNAKQIESQLNRQMKLAAQSASGAAGRPVVTGETDEDFGLSLIEANRQSYASRMARL